jgi:hypothetical protein
VSAADACTVESHEKLKADAVKWATHATPIAAEPVFGLEWKNCNTCSSTLARPVEVRS